VLCAFGGSGPVHATELAESLGMKRILIPPSSGLFSAFGLLFADIAHHAVQTYKRPLAELDVDDFAETLHQMEAAAQAEIVGSSAIHCASGTAINRRTTNVVLQRAVDLRYVGQSFELTLPLAETDLQDTEMHGAQFARTLGERFAAEHERTYGHRAPDDPIEVVNLRLTALIPNSKSQITRPQAISYGRQESEIQNRRCYFGPETGWLDVPVLSRDALGSDSQNGPLIVEEYDATILVPPGCTAARDEWENMVIETQ
jgi:N-methylhydantoinase A